jgi:UDP:flavonoid glycosyltransferase YjiC (YdhE family)
VVPYAPQREILGKASLTITHAGLNTVLDSLSFGVPVLAIPITYEQPAIARRLEWTCSGRWLALRSLRSDDLRREVLAGMGNQSVRDAARRLKVAFDRAGGVTSAAELADVMST